MAKKKASQAKEVVVTDYLSKHIAGAEERALISYNPLTNSAPDVVTSCTVVLNNTDALDTSSPITAFDKYVLDAIYTLIYRNANALQFGRKPLTSSDGYFYVRQIAEIITGRYSTHPGDYIIDEISKSLWRLHNVKLLVDISNEFLNRILSESGKTRKSKKKLETFEAMKRRYKAWTSEDILPAKLEIVHDAKTNKIMVTRFKIIEKPFLYAYAEATQCYVPINSNDYLLPESLKATKGNIYVYAYLKDFIVTAGRRVYIQHTIDYNDMCSKLNLEKTYSQMTRTERSRFHTTICEIVRGFAKGEDCWLDKAKPFTIILGPQKQIKGLKLNRGK